MLDAGAFPARRLPATSDIPIPICLNDVLLIKPSIIYKTEIGKAFFEIREPTPVQRYLAANFHLPIDKQPS
jgi:hypothetical protein